MRAPQTTEQTERVAGRRASRPAGVSERSSLPPEATPVAARVGRACAALYGMAIGNAVGSRTRLMDPERIPGLLPELVGFIPVTACDLVGEGLPADQLPQAAQATIAFARSLPAEVAAPDPAAVSLAASALKDAAVALLGVPLGIRWSGSSAEDHLLGEVQHSFCNGDRRVAAGIAAVAAAVAAGLQGANVPEMLDAGRAAAEAGELRGHYAPGASVAHRLEWTMESVGRCDFARARELLQTLIGTSASLTEAIPAAFALTLLWSRDPWQASIQAALLGGASDTIGALAGALGGAASGMDAFPADAVAMIDRAAGDSLQDLGRRLLRG